MAIARTILGLTAILLLAGGIVMQFFIILSGLYDSPENQFYFLQVFTNGISSTTTTVQNPTRWTYLRLCGVDSATGHNANCGPTKAALPFDPVRNFQTTTGVPPAFYNHSHYFYLSRFAWVMYLIAVFFAVIAIFISLAALFARLGAYLTGFTTWLAVFFQALAASLMTAWTVQGAKHFNNAGQGATIGVKVMAFTWATFAAWFLAATFFCIGGGVSKSKNTQKSSSYFGRKRSTRSRGSFVESESGRRVKDEYE